MKLIAILTFLLTIVFLTLSATLAAAQTQSFSTSAGPVKITPLYHASTLIEAGGKVIYLDPAKPAKLSGLPKADLILITDIHGDHMDPDSIKEISQGGDGDFCAAGGGCDCDQRQADRQWRNQELAGMDC